MRMGRPAVFRDKVKDIEHRVVGFVSKEGRAAFERERHRLSLMYHEHTGRTIPISDADTIEFMARGPVKTRAYIREHHPSATMRK